jgi:hypothetical protein
MDDRSHLGNSAINAAPMLPEPIPRERIGNRELSAFSNGAGNRSLKRLSASIFANRERLSKTTRLFEGNPAVFARFPESE